MRVAAEIAFSPNSACNPNYEFDRHKPRKLEDYMTDAQWEEFIADVDETLIPAKKFQRSINVSIDMEGQGRLALPAFCQCCADHVQIFFSMRSYRLLQRPS